jgi:hypothetical protein
MALNLHNARKLLELAMGDYLSIRQNYYADVYGAVYSYLSGSGSITAPRNQLRGGIVKAIFPTAETAYQDGGAELPLDEQVYSYVIGRQNSEMAYADDLFNRLRIMKKDGVTNAEAEAEAFTRADLWTKTLDGVYAQVKAMAAGNLMLTFGGESGAESCSDCTRLMGQRHRASWWVSHDLIPPSRTFECGGYRCEHYLFTDDGQLFSF